MSGSLESGSKPVSNDWAHGYGQAVDYRRLTFQNHETGYIAWWNGRSDRSKAFGIGKRPQKTGMAQEPNVVEQAVVRALRENLERIQRNADELHQAVGDIVAACASSKPTNALPSMLRAQTSAASLSAALEVLSRFVAMSMQPGQRSPLEAQITHLISTACGEPAAEPVRPHPAVPTPMAQAPAQANVQAPRRVAPPVAPHLRAGAGD